MRAVHGGSLDSQNGPREPIRWGRSRQAALRSDRTAETTVRIRGVLMAGTLPHSSAPANLTMPFSGQLKILLQNRDFCHHSPRPGYAGRATGEVSGSVK